MRVALHCKFCQGPISVDLTDDFIGLCHKWKMQPLDLVKLACCNRCAGLRELRRSLNAKILKVCFGYTLLAKPSEAAIERTRENLTGLVKAYCRMIGRWHFKEWSYFDPEMVEAILDAPLSFGDVLRRCWKVFDELNRQEEFSVTAEAETERQSDEEKMSLQAQEADLL